VCHTSSMISKISPVIGTIILTFIFTQCNLWIISFCTKQISDLCFNQQLTKEYQNKSSLAFGCHNINNIQIENRSYGVPGVNKKAYFGVYEGQEVAVRMATYDNGNNKQCIESSLYGINGSTECSRFGNMKLMKDILMSQEMSHPNMMLLLGYCLRSDEMIDKSRSKHGLLAVYEYGRELHGLHGPILTTIQHMSIEKRLEGVLGLVDLMKYFETSPVGFLGLPDLKPQHLMIVGDKIKMTDFDDATTAPRKCVDDSTCSAKRCDKNGCTTTFAVPCKQNQCEDYHRVNNKRRFGWSIFASIFTPAVREKVPVLEALYGKYWRNKLSYTSFLELINRELGHENTR